MKKHLQFNDITALSLGWRAARRKAEKERRVEREKEQSSSSLLCIFIKENITSPPRPPPRSLFLFRRLAFLSHSFTFFFCSAFLSSVHFYLLLILPLTHFFFFSPLCVFIHLFWPFSFTLEEAVYPTMYLFSCVVLLVL